MANANQILLWALSGCAGFALAGQVVRAATWAGSEASNNWSTPGNWSSNLVQDDADVLFINTDPTTTGVVNNVVDSSLTIRSLIYANTGTNWQVTQIASSQVLTIDAATPGSNAFWAGTAGASSTYQSTTFVEITGAGKLLVNEPAADFLVSSYSTGTNTGTTANSTVLLDLSALAELQADVKLFTVGFGRGANGILHLAETNSITADAISIGRAEWNGSSARQSITSSVIHLGDSNALNTTELLVGSNLVANATFKNANSGTLSFAEGVSESASVIIRGKDGVSAVSDMIVGNVGGDASNGTGGPVTHASIADFTGGYVDALVATLTIGIGNPAGGSSVSGALTMDDGVFEAATVYLGRATGNSSASAGVHAQGTLNIEGGAFTAGAILVAASVNTTATTPSVGYLNISGGSVDVTGDLMLGSRNHANAPGTAQVNITGGVLTVGGNVAEGASGTQTSSMSISNGEMRMTAGDITVDSLSLTGTGYLTLFVGGLGANSEIRGSGSAVLDGTLAFDLTAASTTMDDFWQVVAPTVGLSYGTGFNVAGFTQIAGLWYDTDDIDHARYRFDPTGRTLTVVPEPGAALGLLLAAGVGMMRRTRWRA